jgi:hypothetical protein
MSKISESYSRKNGEHCTLFGVVQITYFKISNCGNGSAENVISYINFAYATDAGSSDISSDMKHRTVDG